MEMLLEVGYCSGIENYSRHLSGRKPGETPNTLLDFFPKDALLFMDESHVTVPQVRGMFAGDFSRKSTLVEHGFRLPERARQPPAAVRRVGEEAGPADLRLGDAGRLRGHDVGRRGRRAGHPPDGPDRPDRPRRARPWPGAGPARRDQEAGRGRRARPDHDAHQAARRGPLALPQGTGRALQVAPLRARRLRAGDDPPRASRGGVRRARRRQPAPRGARPARGLDGLHPRRRQGGVPPERDVLDPDDRPLGPARQRRGRALRRHRDGLDAARHRRDRTAAGPSSSNTTPSTASRPRRSSRRSAAGSRRRSRPSPRPARPSAATR